MKIWHNPRCRKSRETLQILEDKGQSPDIFLYLKEDISKGDLKRALKKLGVPASALVRKGESIFKEKFKGQDLSEDLWIEAMIQYPQLIERPIVIRDERAVLGRPPENVLEII